MAHYEVLRPDFGEQRGDGRGIDALDHEDAAEKRAQYDCQQDPENYKSYEDGVELSVYPLWLESDVPFRVTVTMTMTPHFMARRTK